MTRFPLASAFACVLFVSTVMAQSVTSPPQTQKPISDPTEVVQITTNLVQIDAVVTDRRGQHITDLNPEEFLIYQDGRPQKISSFTYVNLNSADADKPSSQSPKKEDRVPAPPTPPEQLRPDQVRRSIALVVDDLGLSFESAHFVRGALRKFVDEQMQSGDMVAIIRTGAGVGALQQFTTDKRLLHAAIDRLKPNAFGRRGIAAFGNIGEDAFYTEPRSGKRGTFTSSGSDEPVGYDDFKDQVFTVGTLGALNYVVRGLSQLPGRKSAILLTDALDLFSSTGTQNYRALDALRQLIDLANRSSVVFYTIDARGLQSGQDSASLALVGKTEADSATGEISSTGLAGGKLLADLRARSLEIFEAQNGMSYLARQTGGIFINNNNDIAQGIRRVLDQKGYYLMGYRPDESTFDTNGQRAFHRLEVRVTRPNLIVRTRSGFYGTNSEEAKPAYRTREQQLFAALTSPFASGALDLRLTSVFLSDAAYGSYVRSLIHVSGNSLSFTGQPDGTHQASVDVAAVTFDDQGVAIDQRFRTETLKVKDDEYRVALRDGITFGINLPVKKAGAFQLRIAVRDVATSQVGSANQFIEVPDLKKNRLALSGLYLASNSENVQQGAASKASGDVNQGRVASADARSGPAVRRFRPGMMVDYGYEAYNVQLDKATGRAQLQTQVRLFRENQRVYSGQVRTVSGQPGAKRVVVMGRLQLVHSLTPGDYILQVIVTDLSAKDKRRVASQWITFDID